MSIAPTSRATAPTSWPARRDDARATAFRLSGRASLILAAVLASSSSTRPTRSRRRPRIARRSSGSGWRPGQPGSSRLLLLTFQISRRARPEPPDQQVHLEAVEADLPVARAPVGLRVGLPGRPHREPRGRPVRRGRSRAGAFVPGLSSYRSSPVALGTIALYAFLLTAITARYTKLLPAGVWLSIHRLSLVVFVLAWLHGDPGRDRLRRPPRRLYVVSGLAVLGAGFYRYWASRKGRPTFTTSRTEVSTR